MFLTIESGTTLSNRSAKVVSAFCSAINESLELVNCSVWSLTGNSRLSGLLSASLREAARVTAQTGNTSGDTQLQSGNTFAGGTEGCFLKMFILPSAHTLLPAKSFPKIMWTPSTGNWGRTPTATSPSTRPHLRVTSCKGEENGAKPMPHTITQLPVSDSLENGKTDSRINESRAPVSLKILIGTFWLPSTRDTTPSEIKAEKSQ